MILQWFYVQLRGFWVIRRAIGAVSSHYTMAILLSSPGILSPVIVPVIHSSIPSEHQKDKLELAHNRATEPKAPALRHCVTLASATSTLRRRICIQPSWSRWNMIRERTIRYSLRDPCSIYFMMVIHQDKACQET